MVRRNASEDASPPRPERPGEPGAASGAGPPPLPGSRPAEPSADSGPGGPVGCAEAGGRDGQPPATANGGEKDNEYEPL